MEGVIGILLGGAAKPPLGAEGPPMMLNGILGSVPIIFLLEYNWGIILLQGVMGIFCCKGLWEYYWGAASPPLGAFGPL